MLINLDLDSPSRTVETVPAEGVEWETSGTSRDVAIWLGNATEADRQAIRLAARQVAAEGQALRIVFPSMMTFLLGYDFGTQRFRCFVPECTCYKGHTEDLSAIATSVFNCASHGPEAMAPREMHIIDIPGGRD